MKIYRLKLMRIIKNVNFNYRYQWERQIRICGKNLLWTCGQCKKYYIATMQPYGAEGTQRIRRHHALRQGKGFETIEQYQNVSKAFDKVQTEAVSHAAQNEKPVVLLECLSNLMANECFEEGGTPDAVFSDCIQLYRQCRHLVIVTNEIFSDGCLYDNTTTDYITRLGRLNTQLAQEADCVAEVVYSIPVYWKGSYELIQENLPL